MDVDDRIAVRARLRLAGRLIVPALFGVWLWKFADRRALAAAVASVPLAALGPAFLVGFVNTALGGPRWRLLMRAFGAGELPTTATAIRVYFVGYFYNTLVPGAVGGDVVRGAVSRRNFDQPLTSYLVVLAERLIGLSALGPVFVAGFAWSGARLADVRSLLPWIGALLGLGLAIAVGAVLSGRAGRWWRRIPRVHHPADLLGVFGISLAGHALNVATYVLLARGMGLPLTVADLAFAVSLATVAASLPIAIAGMGPREATLVAVLRLLHVAPERGLALSLACSVITLALALTGGLAQLVFGRLQTTTEPT
jgi:uncharacterized membrane protein YbhN (UPF0104 family)